MENHKITRFLIEVWGWVFLIGLFAGIWIPQYRWRLIFTSIVSIILATCAIRSIDKIEKEVKDGEGKHR